MVKVIGSRATITYEILSSDSETENLLQRVLEAQINALVNQDNSKLKSIIENTPAPKKKAVQGQEKADSGKKEFAGKTNLEKPELISLGGEWAYSVALVSDESSKSVRIAKGKVRGNYYRDKTSGVMVLTPDDPMNPISLVNKINIKRLSDWERLQVPVMTRLKALEENGPK